MVIAMSDVQEILILSVSQELPLKKIKSDMETGIQIASAKRLFWGM